MLLVGKKEKEKEKKLIGLKPFTPSANALTTRDWCQWSGQYRDMVILLILQEYGVKGVLWMKYKVPVNLFAVVGVRYEVGS